MAPALVNGWEVSARYETFRIYPKNKQGEVCPVTKVNQYLTVSRLACTITFKRYLHRGNWYYRCSLVNKPIYDLDMRDFVSGLLFPTAAGARNGEGQPIGDRAAAEQLITNWISSKPLV